MRRGRPTKSSKTDNIEVVSLQQKKYKLWKAFSSSYLFGKKLDLDEWCDLYRVLPQETSSEYGEWKTSRFPFHRKIMKWLSPSSIASEIVGMKGAQLGLTELSINWIMYCADMDPGPMMYLQKTDDAAKDFSNQKLKPNILLCDRVRDTLGENKPKKYSNSWKEKAYPGGFVVLGGANSTAFLRGKSIGRATADEEDDFELSVGQQGSPVLLLAMRMMNFPGHKLYRISTPVLQELSTIEPAFNAGSQERYYVSCPHCNPKGTEDGFRFWIKWDQIKWNDKRDSSGLPTDIWLQCPNCAGKIYESKHKTWMMSYEHADWYSEKGSEGKRYKVPIDTERPSFHISSLYSPVGFFSWRDAVKMWFDWLRTKDRTILQVFINQVLGETYRLTGGEISHTDLYLRREQYDTPRDKFSVPAGALCLTAGVDIQDNRIEVETVGWGLLDENWSIDYSVLLGDTHLMGDANGMLPNGQPSVWRLLDEYLYKVWKHETGARMMIECSMIDSNYKAQETHTFCRSREHRRIFPIIGQKGWGKGFWTRRKARHDVYGTLPHTAYTYELKNRVYAQLQIDKPGPGFCHFPKIPKYDEKYFKGLTCEYKKVELVAGNLVMKWENPSGARNEPLDCRNYALVAYMSYQPNLDIRADGDRLIRMFGRYEESSGIIGRPTRRKRGSKGL